MSKNNDEKTIVIIGDWFIDENWLVAKHKTYSSSHTGDVHYLSKHKNLEVPMVNLCGASEVLEVLESYFKKGRSDKYEFIGYGVWNKRDDDILQCILCSKRGEENKSNEENKYQYLTPFTIKGLLDIKHKGKRLCPYTYDQEKNRHHGDFT